jgi:hypothetical protein
MVPNLGHTLRSLLRHPGFLVVTILTLALGVGATSLVFCVVDGLLFQPLPYPAADRLVRVFHTAPPGELPAGAARRPARPARVAGRGVALARGLGLDGPAPQAVSSGGP